VSRENPSFRGHRAARIERAVFDILECDLLPSLEDPALRELHVLHIAVKNLACIEAVLAASDGETRNAEAVNAALAKAEPWMRRELAGALRIKRMPELRLRFVPIHLGANANGGAHE
jgi:ribosome-binding factor A